MEALPAKIRCTWFSLPYHIGHGVFRGLLPLVGLTTCAAAGNIYAYHPIMAASIACQHYVDRQSWRPRETHGSGIWDEAPASGSSTADGCFEVEIRPRLLPRPFTSDRTSDQTRVCVTESGPYCK